jgi:putrescine transport system permease protein
MQLRMPKPTSFMLGLGIVFLYIPIVSLIIYSFNASRLVTVWAGFSPKWYAALLHDQQILDAAWISLRIAFFSATTAVVLGTLAALSMVRYGRFRGHTLFAGMITAPLVMPDVILGLSLLLLFVAMQTGLGWPENRGMLTIWIAHATFCTAYVTVVIASRLRDLDRSLEEAALDLGAAPWKVFFVIMLPGIAPSLVAGWLLSFTLSLDDLVVASFVAGPGSTTLPMVIFSRVRLGVSPTINALATLLVLAVTVSVLLAAWATSRMERKRRIEAQMALTTTVDEDMEQQEEGEPEYAPHGVRE